MISCSKSNKVAPPMIPEKMRANPAHALDGGIPSLLNVGHHGPAPSDVRCSPTSSAMRISSVIILVAIVLVAGCSPAPVVTITNHSSVTLSNVVVSGSGFSERVAKITARGGKRLTVHPKGDTGLRVAFDAGGHHVDSGQQGYFEATGRYRVSAIVSRDLCVSVSADLGEPHAKEGVPTLSKLAHGEEGGQRFVTFEFRVPRGKRVAVMASGLVIDYGTAREMRGYPEWAKESDPSGKLYGPGTKSIFRIIEPPERLLRLQLETRVFEVGPSAWLWKLKRTWQTKRLSALKEWPPPMPFVSVQSEMISSYRSESDGAATVSQPIRSETNRTSSAAGPRRLP